MYVCMYVCVCVCVCMCVCMCVYVCMYQSLLGLKNYIKIYGAIQKCLVFKISFRVRRC